MNGGGRAGRRIEGRAAILAAVAGTLTLAVAACGSEATTSVGPSPVKCDITLTSTSVAVPAAGGAVTFSVATQPECQWSVTTDTTWLTLVSPPAAQGGAQVELRAAANTGPSRSGTVTVGDQPLTIIQAGGCTYTIDPDARTFPSTGGTGSAAVATAAGCVWAAITHVEWISLAPPASGSGSGAVTFTVAGHTGPQRSGTLTVAGRTLTVTQESGCTYSITPTEVTLGPAADERIVTVSAPAGCPWAATSADPAWLRVAPEAGTGAGAVRFTVDALPDSPLLPRVGTLVIAGETLQVTQLP